MGGTAVPHTENQIEPQLQNAQGQGRGTFGRAFIGERGLEGDVCVGFAVAGGRVGSGAVAPQGSVKRRIRHTSELRCASPTLR